MSTSPPERLHPAFEPLFGRTACLGNAARKHRRAVARHGERLLQRLELTGTLSHVHLDRAAPAVAEDFERVVAASRDQGEALLLLGTYYSVQVLHQNARALEQLAFDLAESLDREEAFRAFLERSAEEFSALCSTYVRRVLGLVADDLRGYAILNVGTALHQDDLDIAVIADERADRRAVDALMGRLSEQCLRFASPLDDYVAAEAGASGFCLTLADLERALDSGRLGFVVVTELLRARILAGDADLLERLKEEVTAAYLMRPDRDTERHELFLRGLLGETRSLLLRPPAADRLNPKDDGLRLILGLATAFQAMDGLAGSDTGQELTRLMSRRPERRAPLERLEASRVFLETFRQTSQLLVAPDDDVAVVGPGARENLAAVAAAMGFREWGPLAAEDQLLVHYREAVQDAQAAAIPLMEDVARHLTSISRLAPWTRGAPSPDLASGLAAALVQASQAFRGVRFYDDLLEAFSAPGGARLDAFLRSYAALGRGPRRELARAYARWGRDAPYTLLSILTLLSPRVPRGETADPVDEIAEVFLEHLADPPETVRSMARVFRTYPELVNRFLLALRPERLGLAERALEWPIADTEVAAARDRLRALIRAQRRTSRYIKRVLARVTERHPATVQALSEDAALRRLAAGRLAAAERHPRPEEQAGLLGDFYDVEFLRIAMGTLRGEASAATRAAFERLTRTYVGRLFDLCFRRVEHETGGWTSERDRVGVLLSGGGARGRPYDEDYDLIVLVDSPEPATCVFVARAIALMNAEIARRGVLAQYRIGDWLGSFVARLDELEALFARGHDELFVDRCQLLGARVIVGGRRIAEQIRTRILEPHVFAVAAEFERRLAREIGERRGSLAAGAPGTLNLKESPGGLREIDLALAGARARLSVWEPDIDPWDSLAQADGTRAALLSRLGAVDRELVAIRSAYRVAVAATDEIEPAELGPVARILGAGGDERAEGERLFERLEGWLAESAEMVTDLLAPAPAGKRR